MSQPIDVTRLTALSLLLFLARAMPAGAEDETAWRTLDPAETVYMQLPGGEVVIELNPQFAPATVSQFKRLASAGFYDGLSFYRVVEGFVAQGGDGSDMGGEPNDVPMLPAEFERAWSDDLAFVSVQKPDMFAPETGFIDGFAAGREPESGKVWLTHCPGIIAMARNDGPDTGSTDFYITIGQAPRYLDRNLTIFGRVVDGMDVVQGVIRGPTEANGMIAEGAPRTPIDKIVLAVDLPAKERKTVRVADTGSDGFAEVLRSRKKRGLPFFHHTPPEVLDVCQVPVGTRIESE